VNFPDNDEENHEGRRGWVMVTSEKRDLPGLNKHETVNPVSEVRRV
jgi:hypothetical protein